jgi:nucleoside-diphosphate-sugar epimerase
VHDKGDKGFVPMIINTMKEKGFAAYVGDGNNRWPAVHRLDAAYLFRLALEKGAKGARYNAIGDEGIPIKQLAELVGKHLGMPVKSITPEEATGYFTWMAYFIQFDNPATSFKTIEALNWKPAHIGLLEDMKQHYF